MTDSIQWEYDFRVVITAQTEPTDGTDREEELSRQAILSELDRIMTCPLFCNSKRYPRFLRFVVQEALAGRAEELKERTIGIELFRRDPAYDTDADPVVRITAAEVRKRLTLYYENPSTPGEIRISLRAGSYIPHFDPFAPAIASAGNDTSELVESSLALSSAKSSRWLLWVLPLVALICVSAILGWRLFRTPQPPNAVDAFWKPFIGQGGPVLIGVGTLSSQGISVHANEPAPDTDLVAAFHRFNLIPLADATTLSRVSSLMGGYHVSYRVANSETIHFDALQAGPTVLVGALNNQWTVRLTSKLRFYFVDSPLVSSICDHEARQPTVWNLYRTKEYSSLVQDYAVIARYHDSTTGQMVVIAGGIGPTGTLAAGEFLTRNDSLSALLALAPKTWKGEGVEAVITTEVINGNSGPPHILASSFW